MNEAPKILVAGELFLDLILSGFDVWPGPGQEAFAREFRRDIGGGAAITASGLAKLGNACGVVGTVGADTGNWLVQQLNNNGVNTGALRFDSNEPTAFTVVVSMPHDRTFLTYPGANRGLLPLLLETAKAPSLNEIRHIHLAFAPALDIAADLFQQLHARNCTLSFDIGWHEHWLKHSEAPAILRHVDIFFPNEIEARCITGEDDPLSMLKEFEAAGLRRVAVKLGARGAALLWDGEYIFAPAHPVMPVDTTGAGDCFDAGFLHAWLHGEPPEGCLKIANICGALSTQAHGGIAGFPTLEQLKLELSKGN